MTQALQATAQAVAASSLSRAVKATSNTSSADSERPSPPCAGWAADDGAEAPKRLSLKGLILAQNERWRRGLGMQVERIPLGLLRGGSGERGSKAWVSCPGDRDSHPNGWVIPGDVAGGHPPATKRAPQGVSPREGLTWY